MARLEGIAYKAVKRTGIFHNRPTLHLHLQVSFMRLCRARIYSLDLFLVPNPHLWHKFKK